MVDLQRGLTEHTSQSESSAKSAIPDRVAVRAGIQERRLVRTYAGWIAEPGLGDGLLLLTSVVQGRTQH